MSPSSLNTELLDGAPAGCGAADATGGVAIEPALSDIPTIEPE